MEMTAIIWTTLHQVIYPAPGQLQNVKIKLLKLLKKNSLFLPFPVPAVQKKS